MNSLLDFDEAGRPLVVEEDPYREHCVPDSRLWVVFGGTGGCHVKGCCRSVDCQVSRLMVWVLCWVCGMACWRLVVWVGSRLPEDVLAMK